MLGRLVPFATAAVLGSALPSHVAGQSEASAPAEPAALAFVNARVVDAVGGARPGRMTVVVEGRTIARLGADVAVPRGARVIDLDGRWLAPGLIDAHTHIASRDALRRALVSGVTTARSASTPAFQDVGLRALVRAGALAGPELLAAGVFVSPELGETLLADPRLAALAGGVRTEAALRTVVEVNADRGVDWIKTRGTERAGLPDTDPRKQTYDEAQLRTVVEAGRARGLPVQVHAHGDEGARAAVLAGARSIEHGTYLSDSTLALMKARGTWLVPTYVTVEDLTQPGGDYDDPVLTLRGRHMLPRLAATVQRAHRMGVRIAAGVDTDYGARSVSRVAHECAAFVRLGMTPREALHAATAGGAELLGIAKRTGSIGAGMEADLVVLERNPLDDVSALEDVLMVVSDGRVGMERLPFALPAPRPAGER